MKFNFAIIGFGSAGEKHFKTLIDHNINCNIYIVSKRNHKTNLKNVFFLNNISKIKLIKINLVFICSSPSDHFKNLLTCQKFFGKKAFYFIEKPITNKFTKFVKNIKTKHSNIFVGYQIQYSGGYNKIKRLIKNLYSKKILHIESVCESYLPDWRTNRSFKYGNSLDYENGGVLLELSHEINYLISLFGIPKKVYASSQINKLFKSKVDENISANLIYKNGNIVNLYLNFDNKFYKKRLLRLRTNDELLTWNLIKNEVINKTIKNVKKYNFKSEDTLLRLQLKFILDVMNKKIKNNSSFKLALETMRTIHYLKKSLNNNKVYKIE